MHKFISCVDTRVACVGIFASKVKMAAKFEKVCSVVSNGIVPVTKYRSSRTGLTVCIAQVEGPLVNGFFCLGL